MGKAYNVVAMKETVQRYVVRAQWDRDAKVWWASSEDIPGLVTEAASFDDLVKNVLDIAPDLLAANGEGGGGVGLPIHVMADRVEMISSSR